MASNNLQVTCFPNHTTHVLQPADVSLFKSLKAIGRLRVWHSTDNKPGKADFFRIFTPSWKNAATVANAQSPTLL